MALRAARSLGSALLGVLLVAVASAAVRVNLSAQDYASGTRIETTRGDVREHFANIPYAARTLPFAMPLPVSYDDGVHSGNHSVGANEVNPAGAGAVAVPQGAKGMSPGYTEVMGGVVLAEDDVRCTQLDVFRPVPIGGQRPLRVLVYVHGGMMEAENRASLFYRCTDALRRLPGDVFGDTTIIVAVEYSLGAYGFWHEPGATDSAEDAPTPLERQYGDMPANIALHQVIQVLLWVQRHIARFGGDPRDVTLAGHSAGASLANWTHLVLTRDVLSVYGFAHYPFKKLVLMGGTALLFPAMSADEAQDMQNEVLAPTPCADKPAGRERLQCLQMLDAESLRRASVAVTATWRPVQDGVLVRGTTRELVGRTAGRHAEWETGVRVLITVMAKEASVFCKQHEGWFRRTNCQQVWREFAQTEEVAAAIAEFDKEALAADPYEHGVQRSVEAVFSLPALMTHAAYVAAGTYAQIVRLDAQIEADMHDYVVGKLTALARARLGISLDAAKRLIRMGSRLSALRRAASSAASLTSRTLCCGMRSGRIRSEPTSKSQSRSSSKSGREQTSSPSRMFRALSFKWRGAESVHPSKSGDGGSTSSSNKMATSSWPQAGKAVLERLGSMSPFPRSHARVGTEADVRRARSEETVPHTQPRESASSPEKDGSRSSTEHVGVFGVPHLTSRRVDKLLDARIMRRIGRVMEEHLDGLGAFHGLDQMILLNTRASVRGVEFRADELVSERTAMELITPIHTFIVTGTAEPWGDAILQRPTVMDAHLTGQMSVAPFVRSFRSMSTHEFTDMRLWMAALDALGPLDDGDVRQRGGRTAGAVRLDRDTDGAALSSHSEVRSFDDESDEGI